MAGDKDKKSKPPSFFFDLDAQDVIIIFLVLYVLWNALAGTFPGYVTNQPRDTFFGRLHSLYLDFLGNGGGIPEYKGTRADVVSKGDTDIYDEPGGKVIGTQKEGAKGKVVDGPVEINGEKYWKVDYENGPDGWVKESDLNWPPANRAIDSPVGTYKSTSVYGSPDGIFVGEQPDGAKGKVVDGPVEIDGETWWKVDFENGPDGWVKESDLTWPSSVNSKGTAIETKKDTEYYVSPGEGLLGSKSAGTGGKIIGGPVYKDGEWWWQVEFDDGKTGWVKATDIQKSDTPKTLMGKILTTAFFVLKILALSVSVLFITAIIYTVIKSSQVGTIINKSITPDKNSANGVSSGKSNENGQNKRWQRIQEHIQSENPSDWRLAILECDIVLAEMLEKMGYVGENVGEILKGIEKSDFTSIEAAWEAHRVRNIIAHQGSDFMLSKREAERIVMLYRQVFEEFKFI